MPLYSVNREAHHVAVKYLQEHKLLAFRRTAGPESVFLRHFNPQTDTMFLPATDVHAFGREPGEYIHAPDMMGRTVSFPYVALPRLAVTPAGLEALQEWSLHTFLTAGGMIETIYVVEMTPDSALTLQDLGIGNKFPLAGLGDRSRARLSWSSSRREWTAEGDDCEARVRLQQMVEGLECLEFYPNDNNWDVQLVDLSTP